MLPEGREQCHPPAGERSLARPCRYMHKQGGRMHPGGRPGGGVELGRGQTGLPLSLDILIFYFLKNEDFLEDPHVKCKVVFVDLLGPASRAVLASPASWHTSPWTRRLLTVLP